MSLHTATSGEVLVVPPAEMAGLLDEHEREALKRHQRSIRAILSMGGVRYFNSRHHEERAHHVIEDPIEALGDAAVSSVMLEHTMLGDDISPLDSSYGGYEGEWKIKHPHGDPYGSNLRVFVAKAPFSEITLDDGTLATIVQRRTYAAVPIHEGTLPRKIDIAAALGTASRHATDPRGDVIVAPTSVSLYARKVDQVPDL